MKIEERLELERTYHESEDKLRDESRLIMGLYESELFDEAEAFLVNSLGDIEGLQVLDFGSGTGDTMRSLVDKRAAVTGFDLSFSRLQTSRSWYNVGTDSSQGYLVQSGAEALPFADESFEIVVGKQILHHLDMNLATSEIVRVLRPGGRAVFLEPLIHNPLLEGYRRLTPHLRSPMEKALSVDDVRRLGDHFNHWEHQEFCFFSVLPALLEAMIKPSPIWTKTRSWLQSLDRQLVSTFPWVGRYYWETVITLYR